MDLESLREYCLSFANATEDIQWGDDLLFRVGGKIFAVLDLGEASTVQLSFKCTLEKYAELIELRGIVPAPYLARYGWVALEDLVALDPQELRELLKVSYELVYEKLSKKLKAELEHS